MSPITLRPFHPDDTDWLVARHGALYAAEAGFDTSFAPLVRSILDAFNASHDPACECGWIAETGGTRLGSIFCVRQSAQTAKLRLFLLVPEARGRGVGKRLLRHCMQFARDAGYADMELWTHESHRAACALYRAHGWQIQSSRPVRNYGVDLVEQIWTIPLTPAETPFLQHAGTQSGPG